LSSSGQRLVSHKFENCQSLLLKKNTLLQAAVASVVNIGELTTELFCSQYKRKDTFFQFDKGNGQILLH